MWLISSLPALCQAQSEIAPRGSADLSNSATRFLASWLVQRNVRKAMGDVAAKPVLARKCDLPPNVSSVPRSARQRRQLVAQILSTTLKAIPKYDSLDRAVQPTNIPAADWLDVEAADAFQILRIKHGSEGYLMCKFEESAEYRRTLRQAAVYYVAFEIKNARNSELREWISAWKKAGLQWRLISIGLLED